MLKINMTQAKKLLPAYIAADKPVMLWGGPGIGKSGLARAVANIMGHELQDFRLLMREAVDVHGLPKDNGNGRMTWVYPEEIALASDDLPEKRIMFLDEINAAPSSVQTVAYQMLHERAIDNKALHKNLRFLAAGNRETDGAVANRMPTPLANRFGHIEVSADSESFVNWGSMNNVHPFVLSHIENSPQDLVVKSSKEYTSQKAFPSPRSWENASTVMRVLEAGRDLSDVGVIDDLTDVVASFVGEGIAANFRGYVQIGSKLPRTIDVVQGKAKAKKYELHEQYFISCGVLAYLNELRNWLVTHQPETSYAKTEKFSLYVDNTLKFCKDSFDAETLASFIGRFCHKDWYGFQFNPASAIQKEWAAWAFSGKEGAAALVFAN